jgi:hypothetical protein
LPRTPHSHSRRSDLFLVRLWTTDAGETSNDSRSEGSNHDDRGDKADKDDGGDNGEWWGKVQRAVSGESHEFSNMQGLIELLKAMLLGSKRR